MRGRSGTAAGLATAALLLQLLQPAAGLAEGNDVPQHLGPYGAALAGAPVRAGDGETGNGADGGGVTTGRGATIRSSIVAILAGS